MPAIPAERLEPSNTLGHFINGKDIDDENRSLAVTNPATGRVSRNVACASKNVVERAIEAASIAFPSWRDTEPLKRARVLFRFKQLLEEHSDEIVSLVTNEHGKTIDDSKAN